MQQKFATLRAFLFPTGEDMNRFPQLVVNVSTLSPHCIRHRCDLVLTLISL